MDTAVDLGPVVYEPPLHHSPPLPWIPTPTVLTTGPRWVRNTTRWHRIRSGIVHRGHATHTSLHAWCGQTIYPKGKNATDELPADGAPLCGTCEGRAAGAGHTSPITGPVDLLFSPDRLTAPRWCPGGAGKRAQHLGELVGRRMVRCGACGELVKERNGHGWYDVEGIPRAHQPGPGLVPGCPLHAWNYLVRTTEGVACKCAGIEEVR